MKSSVIVAMLIIATMAFFSGCRNAGEDIQHKIVLVLFDVSPSTSNKSIKDRYSAGFRKVLEGINPGDILVCDGVGGNPLAESDFPVLEKFPVYDPLKDNRLKYKNRLKAQSLKILSNTQGILNGDGKRSKGTRILDAMKVAEKVFLTYKSHLPVLVIFSDGLEQGDGKDFLNRPLSDAGIEDILTKEKANGRLPNLNSVKVYFCGAGYGTAELTDRKASFDSAILDKILSAMRCGFDSGKIHQFSVGF